MRTLLIHLFLTAGLVLAGTAVERSLHSNGRSAAWATGPVKATAVSNVATRAGSTHVASKAPEACAQCHEDYVASYQRTTHAHTWQADLSCEQCHGDPTKHIEEGGGRGTMLNPKNMNANEVSKTCLKCHEKNGEQSHAQLSQHQRAGVACTQCHDLHPSQEQKFRLASMGKTAMLKSTQTELCLSCHKTVNTEFSKPTHHRLKEGIMDCSSCHNPHGTDQPAQLRADKKTLCVGCHQDKRGPYIYEHNAMALDGCTACHEQHGSSARNMLKVRDPRQLCNSCHSREIGGAATPHSRGNLSLQTSGDCTRCHTEIHGSNRNEYFTE